MQYKFVVKDAAEVDIPRILSEAPADQDALLIAVMGDAAALLLRKEFVSQFVKVDHIVVGSESLSSEWGECGLTFYNNSKGLTLSVGSYQANLIAAGWRGQAIQKTHIQDTLAELAAARQYQPKRIVRVKYI